LTRLGLDKLDGIAPLPQTIDQCLRSNWFNVGHYKSVTGGRVGVGRADDEVSMTQLGRQPPLKLPIAGVRLPFGDIMARLGLTGINTFGWSPPI
jgi:hypothetical protein